MQDGDWMKLKKLIKPPINPERPSVTVFHRFFDKYLYLISIEIKDLWWNTKPTYSPNPERLVNVD